ncbi:MAG TPA: signal peptidase I [Dehalococcoidia bacterium]|nr:signal peptidase I [Dehalococcoidia bacterium]
MALGLLLAPVLAFALGRRVVVRGWSMAPALASGEYVLFDRLGGRLLPVRSGDIVLARNPRAEPPLVIKRIAAGPGDVVQVADGVWVNGRFSGDGGRPLPDGAQAWALGRDEYFLLGDALDMSTDSRDYGPVRRNAIKGRAWLVYWPPRAIRWLR